MSPMSACAHRHETPVVRSLTRARCSRLSGRLLIGPPGVRGRRAAGAVGEPSDDLPAVCVQYGQAVVVGGGERAYRVLERLVDAQFGRLVDEAARAFDRSRELPIACSTSVAVTTPSSAPSAVDHRQRLGALGREAIEHVAQRLLGRERRRELAHRLADRDLRHQA